MKKILCVLVGLLAVVPVFAETGRNGNVRENTPSRSMIGSVHKKSSLKWDGEPVINAVGVVSAGTENESPQPNDRPDNREAERIACLSNNVGMDATFVWASRYSNTASYSMMVEDVEHPENNVCFAHVKIQSTDNGVNLSDFDSKYFPVDEVVTCGSWVNKEKLENRILDAKKTTRTLATIGGAVGGAGIGVGAMEVFGNNLLEKAGWDDVQGQNALSKDELFISQMKIYKEEQPVQYKNIMCILKELKDICDGSNPPDNCNTINYKDILKRVLGNNYEKELEKLCK